MPEFRLELELKLRFELEYNCMYACIIAECCSADLVNACTSLTEVIPSLIIIIEAPVPAIAASTLASDYVESSFSTSRLSLFVIAAVTRY